MKDLNIKEIILEDFKCFSYKAFGENPENKAWEVISKWAKENDVLNCSRIFGFNNPNPIPQNKEYGYEFCLKLNKEINKEIPKVFNHKTIKGGKFISVKISFDHMEEGWKLIRSAIKSKKYRYDDSRQWLEEHVINKMGEIDYLILMSPIK